MKKDDTMLKLTLAAMAALPLAACATIEPTQSEMAYCQEMERTMGTEHAHDHGHAKGMGLDPMNVTHDRCRKMLSMS
jgi:hypothetical protein